MDNMPFPAALIDDIPQVCVLCGIYFSNALSLQYHMRLHTGLQDPGLYETRPPPLTVVPSTTSNASNSSHASSIGSVPISPVATNTTMPKQDFELGLEFLNSLTQMYANPTVSRENKEKGFDFRYEPNTSSQTASGNQDIGKHNESQKYNFDDFYNSPGDDMLDKKFESVLDFELSKDNGMHFGNIKQPLESVLDDEPPAENEKASDKVVDAVSQMYHNELRKELDNISNDSIKSDEETKFNHIKIPDLPESDNEEKNTGDKIAKEQPAFQNNDIQAKDSPSFEDEIPKVGKFMKIKKYFQSQEMRKKERSSVEKSDIPPSQSDDKADTNQKNTETDLGKVQKENDKDVNEKTKNAAVSSDNKSSEITTKKDQTDFPKEENKESSDHEEIGINIKSLRRRPNKVEESDKDKKRHNVRKRANPRRCVRKDQVDEKLKELAKENVAKENVEVMKEEENEKDNENKQVQETEAGKEALKENTAKEKEELKEVNPEKLIIRLSVSERLKESNIETELSVKENGETVKHIEVEKQIVAESQQNLSQTEAQPVTENNCNSDTDISESEESEGACCSYGQETVEPLKIKIWKIKPPKKKKHKKKKRKKHRKDRSSTESLVGYTEMKGEDQIVESKQERRAKRYREKKHMCEDCGQGFGQKCDLRKHIMIHTGERPWVCEVCEKTFQRKTDLVKHMRIHTGEKPYECEYCGKKVSDKSQLNVHRRLHTGDRPYQCDICSKGCITSSELTRHRQTHFSDRPWKCEVCQKGFKLKECLAIHMKIHNGTKKYQCAKCGLGFDKESKMERHLMLHEIDNPYMCRECGADFENKAHYANHIKSHRKEQRGPYSCDYCGRLYEYKSSLEPHLRSHTGEKPFICELCNNAYSLKGNLKHHMKVHHGDNFYKCATCSETFHLKRDLINHSKIHPEDQLHCHYCDSHFEDQESADNHREECSVRKSYDVDDTDNPAIACILDNIDDEFAKSFTPQGKLDEPPVRDKKELDKIYEFDDSDSEIKTKVKPSVKKDFHSHTSPRNKDLRSSPRSRDPNTRMSPKGAKRSRDPEIPKPLTISALLNSPPMNKKQKSIPQPKVDKLDPFQGIIDKSAVLSNKDDELDLFQRPLDTSGSSTLPNLTVSDKTDLFENIIENSELDQSKDGAPVTFSSSLSSTTESSVFSSKDTIDSLLSTAPVITQQQTDLPATSKPEISPVTHSFPGYIGGWKNDLAPSTDYLNPLLLKSLNGPTAPTPSTSCNKFDADDSLSKFNLDYLNPLIMKTLNADLKFDTNENLQKSNPFYAPTSSASSGVFPTTAGSYSYKTPFSAPSETQTRVDTYTTADYMNSLARTIGMPNVEKLAMDFLYQSSVASEKQDFQQKFGLTGKTDPSVPLPSFNYLNTVASNQDTLNDALDMSAFSGLPSMSAFTRNSDFNAHLAAPSAYGGLDITKSLPSGEKIDETAALLSNFEYGT